MDAIATTIAGSRDIDKGVVRRPPATKRAQQLFGAAGASALADEIETAAAPSPQLEPVPGNGIAAQIRVATTPSAP